MRPGFSGLASLLTERMLRDEKNQVACSLAFVPNAIPLMFGL
jgi:hypothetical protein